MYIYTYIYIYIPISLAWSVKSLQDAFSILTTDWPAEVQVRFPLLSRDICPGDEYGLCTLQTNIYIYICSLFNFQLTHLCFLNISCIKNPFLQASMMWLHSRDLQHEHRSALHPLPLLQLQADAVNLVACWINPRPPRNETAQMPRPQKRSRDRQCQRHHCHLRRLNVVTCDVKNASKGSKIRQSTV